MEAQRPATYDDLLAVPDHLVAEIVDGELYTSPRPGPPRWLVVGAWEGDARIHAEPFDAVELDTSHWWVPAEDG